MTQEADKRLHDYLRIVTERQGGPDAALTKLSSAAETAGGMGLEDVGGAASMVEIARRAHQAMESGRDLSHDERMGTEAIIDAEIRPAINVVDGSFSAAHPLWSHLSDDSEIRTRIEGVLPGVGRIELPGHSELPYAGTGFVVGDGLIMTNRHVAEVFATGVGQKHLRFLSGAQAGIDFRRELDRASGPTLMVRKVVMIHPYWDMALLQVDGLPKDLKPLRLSLQDARELPGQQIFVVGYRSSTARAGSPGRCD